MSVVELSISNVDIDRAMILTVAGKLEIAGIITSPAGTFSP